MNKETNTDKLTTEEAEKNRLLIREDIRKYELSKAQMCGQLAQLDAMIAECELALADIDRREAGVQYPAPQKKEEKKDMEIVGGEKEAK